MGRKVDQEPPHGRSTRRTGRSRTTAQVDQERPRSSKFLLQPAFSVAKGETLLHPSWVGMGCQGVPSFSCYWWCIVDTARLLVCQTRPCLSTWLPPHCREIDFSVRWHQGVVSQVVTSPWQQACYIQSYLSTEARGAECEGRNARSGARLRGPDVLGPLRGSYVGAQINLHARRTPS